MNKDETYYVAIEYITMINGNNRMTFFMDDDTQKQLKGLMIPILQIVEVAVFHSHFLMLCQFSLIRAEQKYCEFISVFMEEEK